MSEITMYKWFETHDWLMVPSKGYFNFMTIIQNQFDRSHGQQLIWMHFGEFMLMLLMIS